MKHKRYSFIAIILIGLITTAFILYSFMKDIALDMDLNEDIWEE